MLLDVDPMLNSAIKDEKLMGWSSRSCTKERLRLRISG
jgi:hypothetical protein